MKKENKLTRDDAEDFLQSKGVFNHPYISFGDKENSMELADLMVEFANKYSQVKPFEPKIGDDVIVWNEPRNQDASITKMTTHSPFIWDMVVRWDGTKEQFDRIRNGGNK